MNARLLMLVLTAAGAVASGEVAAQASASAPARSAAASAAAPARSAAASAPASPPSSGKPRRVRSTPPPENPYVQKVEAAEMPGVMRPENEVRAVPQVNIPLRQKGVDPVDPSQPVTPGRVDDRAARCMAMKTKEERAKCEQAINASK